MQVAFWNMAADGRVRISLQAGPGASKTELVEVRPDCLRVRLAAAPDKGKANAELIEYLAGRLGIRKSALELESGQTSRRKTVLAPAECLAAVIALADGQAPPIGHAASDIAGTGRRR